MSPRLKLKLLASEYSVCKIDSISKLQQQGFPSGFYSITHCEDEVSLVCQANVETASLAREDGWRMLKIDQLLAFDEVGVIAKISTILKDAKISIFVISTYNTDYVMLKQQNLQQALAQLNKAGYIID